MTTSIIAQQHQLEEAVSTALTLTKQYSDAAEVAVTQSTGIAVSTRFGEVENIEFNSDGALGITVYHGQKKGSTSTSDLSVAAIEAAVKSAIDIAKYTADDKAAGLADKTLMAFDAPDLDLYHPTQFTPELAIEAAAQAENTALAVDSRITESDGGSCSGYESIRVYGNTHGLLKSYLATRFSTSCSVIAQEKDDMVRNYEYSVARAYSDLVSPQAIGQSCAQRTLAGLGARRLPTMTAPVMFAADVATGLFGHLVGAISGRSIYQKSSFLLDQLGQPIFPEFITIAERPHIIKGLASTPFDSEGVSTRDQNVIDQGVLTTYLLTSYSAKKLGMQSTGHAGGIHNWRIAGHGRNFAEMLTLMDRGLLVTELMGQGVNGVTGDYSRGAAGFWVENGQIQYPVHEVTIAGNLKEMYQQIVAVGDDIETRSNIQCGSVLIESMKIAGE